MPALRASQSLRSLQLLQTQACKIVNCNCVTLKIAHQLTVMGEFRMQCSIYTDLSAEFGSDLNSFIISFVMGICAEIGPFFLIFVSISD